MWLSKEFLNEKTYTVSNYWRVSEYTHLIDEDKVHVVVKWYVSKEIRDEHWANANNDVRVYYLDTKKKVIQEPVMETVVVPAVLDENGVEITPEQTTQVATGEYTDVRTNEADYVKIDQLTAVIVPFMYQQLSSRWDFLWASRE